MSHEDKLLVAKCYVENESFRKEYEALTKEKNETLDAIRKSCTLNFKGYKEKEERLEVEFEQKVADLCKQTAEKTESC